MNTSSPYTAPFNRLEITSGVLDIIEDAKERAILDRVVDSILQPGILIPANASAVDIQDGVPTQFAITNPGGGNITVGAGIAYNSLGERIEVPAGDTTVYNANAPTFTSTISGVGPIQLTTPYSTGAINVPPLNPSTLTTRFVFIQYVQVLRTKALPPDHGTPTGSVVTLSGGDSDNKKPITELDQKEGLIYAPHYIDGYKILTGELSDVTIVGSTPSLNADPTAVFIGRYDLIGGPPATNVTNIVMSDGLYSRKVLLARPENGSKVDTTNKTPAYADQQVVSTQEHVSALGGGTPTSNNPHALTLADMNVTLPDVETVIRETMADGIIDAALQRNSPIPVNEALDPQISIPVDQISFKQLGSGQVIYLGGKRFTKVNTALSTSSSDPVLISFSVTNGPGIYTIYAEESVTVGEVTLKKSAPNTPAPAGTLVVVTLYWDNTALTIRKTSSRDGSLSSLGTEYQDFPGYATKARPVDKRSFGLITTEQISTEAVADPLKGLLAPQTFRNQIFNPEFFLKLGIVTSTGAGAAGVFSTYLTADSFNYPLTEPMAWTATSELPPITVAISGVTPTQVPDMLTSGPKTNSAAKIAFTGTDPLLRAKLRGHVTNLKPNATYTLFGWMRVNAPGPSNLAIPSNTTISLLGRLLNYNASLPFTLMKDIPFDPTIVTWQRFGVTIKTDQNVAGISPNLGALVEFNFINQGVASPAYASADFYLTGLALLEGEWTVGPLRDFNRILRYSNPGVSTALLAPFGAVSAAVDIFNITVMSVGQPAVITCQGFLDDSGASGGIITRYTQFFVDGTNVGYQENGTFAAVGGLGTPVNQVPLNMHWAGWLSPGPHVIRVSLEARQRALVSNTYSTARNNWLEVVLQ